MDLNNFNLGQYVSIAFNNPKGYPSQPFLAKEESLQEEPKDMSVEEMERVMLKNTIILGGTTNGNKS